MSKDTRGLTPQQEKFCLEYLVDFNPQKAAERAGYSGRSVDSYAYQLLRNPKISDRVREGVRRIAKRNELSAAKVLNRAKELVDSNVGEIISMGPKGLEFLLKDEIAKSQLRAVELVEYHESSGEQGSSTKIRVKMHSKGTALSLLFRYFKLINDNSKPDSGDAKRDVKDRLLGILEKSRGDRPGGGG